MCELLEGETLRDRLNRGPLPPREAASIGVQVARLYGVRAFPADTPVETMTAILREDPPLVSMTPAVPATFDRIVTHCLERAPENRFQTARDLASPTQANARTCASGSSAGARQ